MRELFRIPLNEIWDLKLSFFGKLFWLFLVVAGNQGSFGLLSLADDLVRA